MEDVYIIFIDYLKTWILSTAGFRLFIGFLKGGMHPMSVWKRGLKASQVVKGSD